MWPAPLSPEPLLQERPGIRGEPWRLLVVCILCNKTRGEVAWPLALELFRRWPEAACLAEAPHDELEGLIRPLGLQRNRTRSLVRFSRAYSLGGWSDPLELPGVGRYARDAWSIFVEGRSDVDPADGHLNRYVAWRKACGTWSGTPPIPAQRGGG